MKLHLSRDGLWFWTGEQRGWKVKRTRDLLFSDRYVHRKWRLFGEWWLIRVVPSSRANAL